MGGRELFKANEELSFCLLTHVFKASGAPRLRFPVLLPGTSLGIKEKKLDLVVLYGV